MFLPHCEQPNFTPIQNNRHNYSSVHLIFKFMNSKLEDKTDVIMYNYRLTQLIVDYDLICNGYTVHSFGPYRAIIRPL
jgi:aspartyl-tRNA synthetase